MDYRFLARFLDSLNYVNVQRAKVARISLNWGFGGILWHSFCSMLT